VYLLAECEYLIVDTSSSFSRVASLLTSAPPSNVFDVKRGGKPRPLRREVIWRLWLELGLFAWGPRMLRRWVTLHRCLRARRRRDEQRLADDSSGRLPDD
jgi:hypothetical protein